MHRQSEAEVGERAAERRHPLRPLRPCDPVNAPPRLRRNGDHPLPGSGSQLVEYGRHSPRRQGPRFPRPAEGGYVQQEHEAVAPQFGLPRRPRRRTGRSTARGSGRRTRDAAYAGRSVQGARARQQGATRGGQRGASIGEGGSVRYPDNARRSTRRQQRRGRLSALPGATRAGQRGASNGEGVINCLWRQRGLPTVQQSPTHDDGKAKGRCRGATGRPRRGKRPGPTDSAARPAQEPNTSYSLPAHNNRLQPDPAHLRVAQPSCTIRIRFV